MAKLIVYPAPGEESEVDLSDRPSVSIGRHRNNDIVLKWRMASRSHAAVQARSGRFFVIDAQSYNGTFVN